jgi:hypothetical protein
MRRTSSADHPSRRLEKGALLPAGYHGERGTGERHDFEQCHPPHETQHRDSGGVRRRGRPASDVALADVDDVAHTATSACSLRARTSPVDLPGRDCVAAAVGRPRPRLPGGPTTASPRELAGLDDADHVLTRLRREAACCPPGSRGPTAALTTTHRCHAGTVRRAKPAVVGFQIEPQAGRPGKPMGVRTDVASWISMTLLGT